MYIYIYTCAIQELWLGICRSTAFWPDSLPHLVLPAVLHTFPSRLRSRCFSCEKCAAQKLIGRYNAIQPVVPVFKEPCHYVGKHYLSSRPNGRWGKQRKTCRGICEMHEVHCASLRQEQVGLATSVPTSNEPIFIAGILLLCTAGSVIFGKDPACSWTQLSATELVKEKWLEVVLSLGPRNDYRTIHCNWRWWWWWWWWNHILNTVPWTQAARGSLRVTVCTGDC